MEKRILYSRILKVMALIFSLVVFAVMVNSFFPAQPFKNEVTIKPVVANPVEVDLSGLARGKIRLVQWQGRAIGVIKRMDIPKGFKKVATQGVYLDAQWRSVKPEYFVFFNSAGAAQCPLYFQRSGDKLQDTCARSLYNTAGISDNSSLPALRIPPHYFRGDQLVIGKWSK